MIFIIFYIRVTNMFNNYKEIVTKTVIGKCKKTTNATYIIECENMPNTILGCWIINHSFNGTNNNGKVNINGSFDINVWYSYDNDSKTSVCVRTFNYSDIMNVPLKNEGKLDSTSEIIVNALKQPTVSDAIIKDGKVSLKVSKELGVEVIGNATMKVAVEDDYDDYEEIYDDNSADELNINVDDLNEDYLKESTNNG